ncbi:ser arg-related nuclear matrix protein-like protein [Ceratocystis lukuohia]|uniref:Ser arg-related nuclear matrix protein-like protein n=1 Tax=Ceratocystis lukuohia TaxID=2019550 RepID=A0ABR4MK05_9PEZI
MHSSSPSNHRPSSPPSHLDTSNNHYSSAYSSVYSYSYSGSRQQPANSRSPSPNRRGRDEDRSRAYGRHRESSGPDHYSYSYSSAQGRSSRENEKFRLQERDPSPTPPPPPPRTSQPKTFPVSYNTTRKSAIPPPPPPSCEDEDVSLAREHDSPIVSQDPEIYGICRGELQQDALMIENEDHVPKFMPDVIVQQHESPSLKTEAGRQHNPNLFESTKAFVLLSDPGSSPPQSEQKANLDAFRESHSKTPNRDQQSYTSPSSRPVIIEKDGRNKEPDEGRASHDDEDCDWGRNFERDRRRYSSSYSLHGKSSRLDLRSDLKNDCNESTTNTFSTSYSNSHSSHNLQPTASSSGVSSATSYKDYDYNYDRHKKHRSPSANAHGSGRQDYREEYRSPSAKPANEYTTPSGSKLFGPKPEPGRSSDRTPEVLRYKADYSLPPEIHTNVSGTNRSSYSYNSTKGSPVRNSVRDHESDFTPPAPPVSIPVRPKSASDRRRASVIIHEEMPRVSGPRNSEPHIRTGSRAGYGSSAGLASSPMSPPHSSREHPLQIPTAHFARDHLGSVGSDSRATNAPYPEDEDLPDVMARSGSAHLGDGTRSRSRGTRSKYPSPSPSPYSVPGATGPAGPRSLQQSASLSSSLRRAEPTLVHETDNAPARSLDIISVNSSVGAWRRYLEEPTRYGLPSIPVCHFSPSQPRELRDVAFMTLRDVPDFDICVPCYKAVFASGPYKNQFVESVKPAYAGSSRCCDFGAVPWFQLGWIMALKRREARIGDIYERIMKHVLEKTPSCSSPGNLLYMYTLRNQWANETNILPDFAICPRCMEGVFALLPNVFQSQLCVQVKPTDDQECALRHSLGNISSRFTNIFNCIEVCSDRGTISSHGPDGRKLVEDLRQLVGFAECSGSNSPRYNEDWYVIADLADLTMCGDCYHTYIKPLKHSELGKRLVADKHHRAFGTCELNSSRMKSMLSVALQTRDFAALRRDIYASRRPEY